MKKLLLLIDGISMVCKLSYVYGRTDSFTALMFLGRIKYVRNSSKEGVLSLMPFQSWLGTGMFAVRFVDWWNAQPGLNQPSTSELEYIPPTPPKTRAGVSMGRCAICIKELVEPVSTPAGFVFCAACLKDHLAQSSTCPVTGEPLIQADIVPVFLD